MNLFHFFRNPVRILVGRYLLILSNQVICFLNFQFLPKHICVSAQRHTLKCSFAQTYFPYVLGAVKKTIFKMVLCSFKSSTQGTVVLLFHIQ